MSRHNRKRIRIKQSDYEKGAIIYLALFRKVKDTKIIKISEFDRRWRQTFKEDKKADTSVIKGVFKETVQKAGNTEASIKSYRKALLICPDRKIPQELLNLTKGKDVIIQIAKNTDTTLSGYRILRRNDNCVIKFPDYSGTAEEVEKFLRKAPCEEKMQKCEASLTEILNDNEASFNKKTNALHRYDLNICSHKFAMRIENLIKKTYSKQILHEAVLLADRLNIRNMSNNQRLYEKINKNAHLKLEKISPFNNPKKVKKMVDKMVEISGLKEIDCSSKEQMKLLKRVMFELYPKEADLVNDRCENPQLFGKWISKYIGEDTQTGNGSQS